MDTPVKEKIIQFIDSQGVSIRNFCKEILVSSSYFTKKGAISTDVLQKIVHKYPQLNINWVVTGMGEMLVKEVATSAACSTCLEWERKYYSVLEKYNDCLESK